MDVSGRGRTIVHMHSYQHVLCQPKTGDFHAGGESRFGSADEAAARAKRASGWVVAMGKNLKGKERKLHRKVVYTYREPTKTLKEYFT